MPGLLYLDKRKPIPGEWEYDMHPGPYTQNDFYDPVYEAPLYQGERGGFLSDWIPYEPTPYEPPPYEPIPYEPIPYEPTPTTPLPTDPGEFFPIDDPSWTAPTDPTEPTEFRIPYSELGSIMWPYQAKDLRDYVKDWERPGWTTDDFEQAGLFSIGRDLATTDPSGYFEDNKYPSVPIVRNTYAQRQKLLEEQTAILEGRKKFEDGAARDARLNEVVEQRHSLLDQQREWLSEDYRDLFKIGTPYEIEWYGHGSQTGDEWKVAPEAGEPFGEWGIYSGGTAGSFTPNSPTESSTTSLYNWEPPSNNDGLLGIVGGGIIDPGPVYSEGEYAANLPPTTESAPLSIAYDSYSGSPYTY